MPRRPFLSSIGRQQRALDVIAIATTVIDGMRGREGDAVGCEQKSGKQTRVLGIGSAPLAAGIHCKLSLDLIPGLSIDDGFMFSFVAPILVWNAADIDRTGKDAVKVPTAERRSP